MAWISMQPNDDAESLEAVIMLRSSGECKFDLSKCDARLRPIAFGSRSCSTKEQHFHSFVGKVASGRWAIGQAGFEDDLVYGTSKELDTHQCYQITASPTSLDWRAS